MERSSNMESFKSRDARGRTLAKKVEEWLLAMPLEAAYQRIGEAVSQGDQATANIVVAGIERRNAIYRERRRKHRRARP
jgi:hypothetical protein